LQPPPTPFPLTAALLILTSSYLLHNETYRTVSAVDKAGPTGEAANLHSAKPRFLSLQKQAILIRVSLAPI